MQKTDKKSVILSSVLALAACSHQVRDDHLVLDYDWKPDVYNLVYAHVADVDNLRFWVRRVPQYHEDSPYQQGCVEVAQPMADNRFYIVNLNSYGLTEVKNCEGDYLAFGNLVEPKRSQAFDVSAWQDHYGIEVTDLQHSHWLLKFENLFVVNQYQLTEQGRHTLLAMLNELHKLPVESVLVYGIADSSGPYRKNRQLSALRASVVREFLVEEGMRNTPINIRASVENALPTAPERVTQRRFMIEVKLKDNEK